MELGICDMEASFVPRAGNQMGVPDVIWQARRPEDRLRRSLEIIGASPFDFVELGAAWINDGPTALPIDQIRVILDDCDIPVGAYNSYIPPDMAVVGPAVDWDNVQRYVRATLANCSRLGGAVVVFGSGDSRMVPDDYEVERAIDDAVRFLKINADIIENEGFDLRIAVEALNTDECNFLNTLAEADHVVRQTDSNRIGLLVDCYHMCRQGNDYWKELEQVIGRVIHIQIVEPPTRRQPGYSGESAFDYKKFFRLLREQRFAEKLSVEAVFERLADEISPCHAFLKSFLE